jgi:adenylate cyclase
MMGSVDRRLAAILVADMEQYSRLMHEDERGTVLAWQHTREEVIKPTLASHSGNIIKNTGDGFVAEFATVSGAVECAVAMQTMLVERNSDRPEGRHLKFRMGINLGEITVDEDDFYGDGVNVAARLEGLAEAPGICISSHVYDQVRKKVTCSFEDLGDILVKNIADPIHVYRILCGHSQAPAAESSTSGGDEAQMPSIAVLPFNNMSSDPEQEFFADGLTEDIITELSRFSGLFVISRNSTFTFKGKTFRAADVARELNARYVVEGSVRKAGNRVRINVQLIDGVADQHVWAERYDRDLEDIFAVQDEITSAIAATLPGRVEADTANRARRIPTESMPAYECVLAGKLLHHKSRQTDNAEALRLLDRAIELDPGYAHARAWRACVLGQALTYGWFDRDKDEVFDELQDEVSKALALDENDTDIHRILAAINIARNNLEQAQHHQQKAHRLNPNYDLVVVQSGELLTWQGRPEEGIELIRQAMELNPFHPPRFWGHLGRAYCTGKHYAEAVSAIGHIESPDILQLAFMAASHAWLGDGAQAERHVGLALRQDADLTVTKLMTVQHYGREKDIQHFRDGLLKAGFVD